MKISNDVILTMDAVDVYKMVLSRGLSRFPVGFWMRPEAYDNAVKCVVYLIEERLNIDINNIPKEVSKKTFMNNKLGGMIGTLFNNSPIDAIELTYPKRFKPWEFNQVPNGFWDIDENVNDALEWLLAKIPEEEISEKWNIEFIHANDLRGLLDVRFKSSPYRALNHIRPNMYKAWQLSMSVPNNYWDSDLNTKEALEWLIEKETLNGKLLITDIWNINIFKDNGLKGLIDIRFGASPYKALNYIRTGEFKPWQLEQVSKGYWDLDANKIEALEWLILRVKNNNQDILEVWSQNLFIDNGLMGLLRAKFESSPFKALEYVRKGKYQPWELNTASRGYWESEENWCEALERVVNNEEEQGFQVDLITVDTLSKYNLTSFLKDKFKGNLSSLNKFAREQNII